MQRAGEMKEEKAEEGREDQEDRGLVGHKKDLALTLSQKGAMGGFQAKEGHDLT